MLPCLCSFKKHWHSATAYGKFQYFCLSTRCSHCRHLGGYFGRKVTVFASLLDLERRFCFCCCCYHLLVLTLQISRMSAQSFPNIPVDVRDHLKMCLSMEGSLRPDALACSKVDGMKSGIVLKSNFLDVENLYTCTSSFNHV